MQAYDFTCGGEFAQGNSVQLDISYDNDAGNPPGATFGTLTVDAYDWIALELMEDIPGIGLKSGQGLVVPGIWAQWLFHWMNSPEAALTEPEVQLISQIVLFLATDGATSILEGAFVAEAGQVAVLEARIVGQDMRGVMVSESVETPIVLEMEADVNGVFTYNKLKWEQGYQADAQLVGRMPNPKFKSQGGDVVQRELLVVRTSAGICVRDATAVVQSIVQQRTSFWTNWINKCFPGKNWNNTTFITKGKEYNSFKSLNASIYNDMKALEPNELKLQEYIESGSTTPIKVPISQGDEFYKIVTKGGNINGPSGYYIDITQLNVIKANPQKIEQILGLPLNSVDAEYDIFKITYKDNNGYVFKSTVAATEQFAKTTPSIKYTTTGGGIQTIIMDNGVQSKWLKGTTPIESISPNQLPQIGN